MNDYLGQTSFHAGMGHAPAHRSTNVGESERWYSMLGGGALALIGLNRGSLSGMALAAIGAGFVYRGITGHCNLYEQLGINTAVPHAPARGVRAQHGFKVEQTIHVNRSPEDLYQFWSNLENLPNVMRHVRSVRVLDDTRSHWVAEGPFDKTVEWDAEIINRRENELIAWRSVPGGDVDTAGSVHFNRDVGGNGTNLVVSMKYDPPGGKAGAILAGLLGRGLEQELNEDLQRFKQTMEAGEIPTRPLATSGAQGQSWARRF